MLKWFLMAILNVNILIHFIVNDLSSRHEFSLPFCKDRHAAFLRICLAARLIPLLSPPCFSQIALYFSNEVHSRGKSLT